MTGDPKHPACWKKNPGVLSRTNDRRKHKEGRPRKSFKDALLEICKKQDDIFGNTKMVRSQGSPFDLPAADARN